MDTYMYLVCGIVAVVVLILLTLLGVAIYSGLLHDIKISVGKPHVSNITVAYKFDRGPYQNCGYLFTEASSVAPKLRCIGVYYDDPQEVQLSLGSQAVCPNTANHCKPTANCRV